MLLLMKSAFLRLSNGLLCVHSLSDGHLGGFRILGVVMTLPGAWGAWYLI